MTHRFEEFQDSQGIIVDISENSLAAIPTFFGRLNYLASLREAASARYRHYGLEQLYGENAAQFGLALCHAELFYRILEMPLEEQERDLREFLTDLVEPSETVVRNWRRLEPYGAWAPLEASESLLRLFLSNLRILLDLFSHDWGLSSQAA